MEDLPVPLSRVELYLAKACGMDVTVPEAPESRLEQYLAILAGDTSVEMPAPMSLTEQWLAYVLGVTPDPLLAVEGACYIDNQKVDVRYFAVAAGMPGAVLPLAPQNRKEQYWANIQGGGGGVLKYATGTNIALTDVVRGITSLENVYGNTTQDGTPTPDAPVAVNVVTGEQSVWVHGKNLANPQTFIDWIDTTYDLCVQYSWGNEDTRPKYGAYQNRNHVARFSGATLYSVRNSMTNPTYDEAIIVYQNMGFKENTRYTISFDINSTGSGTAPNLQFLYTDGTTSNISGASKETWTHCAVKSQSGKTISCIRIIYLTGLVYLDLDTLQIEEGDATTYESYKGSTYSVDLGSTELCKIGDYQDYIYKSGDDWYIHKETGGATYDGSENWTTSSTYGRAQSRKKNSNWVSWGTDQSTYASKGFSNYVKAGNTSNSGLDNVFNVGTNDIFVKATSAGTNLNAATWKAWLNTHNLVCYTILATPTDTKITANTLIGQLEALNSASLPAPVAFITVNATDTNLPGALKISYYGEEE